jgi:catechol 2,3-dioxygenase-like lactoylglutathione lyase family enzyme
MTIQLDHVIISSRDRRAAARQLGDLLGVPWGDTFGPFTALYLNDSLTFDFIDTDQAFPVEHFCFRVTPQEFDAILARIDAAGIAYRSRVHGPVDRRVDTQFGGKGVYWNEPDGHQWEMLTVSYARQPS